MEIEVLGFFLRMQKGIQLCVALGFNSKAGLHKGLLPPSARSIPYSQHLKAISAEVTLSKYPFPLQLWLCEKQKSL